MINTENGKCRAWVMSLFESTSPSIRRRGHGRLVFGCRRSCCGTAVVAAFSVAEIIHGVLGSSRMVVFLFVGVSAVAHGADEPRCATRTLPGPVFLEVVLAGLDVAARDKDNEADETVENSVNKNATYED
jgi:amino acid transporter